MQYYNLIGRNVLICWEESDRPTMVVAHIDNVDEFGLYFTVLHCKSGQVMVKVNSQSLLSHSYKYILRFLTDAELKQYVE